MQIPKLLLIVPFLLISACGGGGGGGAGQLTPSSSIAPVDRPSTSYKGLLSDASAFLGAHNFENGFSGHLTAPENMPSSAKATYSGSAVVSVGDCTAEKTPHLVGKSQLVADFANRKISGSVHTLIAAPNHSTKGGKLNVSGNISDGRLSGKLTGNVSFDGKNHAIDGPLNGAFLNKANAIVLHSGGRTKSNDKFSAIITGSEVKAKK